MAKRRMIWPELWEDEHFGKMSNEAKLLFIACISNADDDGRLSANTSHLRAIAFRYKDISLNKVQEYRNELQAALKHFKIYVVDGCEYVQLEKWTEYQKIRADRYTPSRLPGCGLGAEVQPNDRIGKGSLVKVSLDKVSIDAAFADLWSQYPKKVGQKASRRHFEATVKTKEDIVAINTAMAHYKASKRVKRGYVQNASTWFNDWQTWVDFTEEPCGKCNDSGSFVSTTGYEGLCDCPAGKARAAKK